MKHTLTILIVLLLAPQAALHAADVPKPKPNIIFILADDLGWTDLACYGSDLYETPHLDQLSRRKPPRCASVCTLGGARWMPKCPCPIHATTPLARNTIPSRRRGVRPCCAIAAVELMPNLPEPFALPDWREQAQAYEGLRHEWQSKSPCATGDPLALQWGPKTDLGLYGSSYAGMLGAIVRRTSDPRILQLDCLATDFFRGQAWPTFLCYNPDAEPRSFDFSLGAAASDIYDVVTDEFVAREVRDTSRLTLPPDSAALYVVAPAGSPLTRDGRRILLGDVVVNWAVPQPAAQP